MPTSPPLLPPPSRSTAPRQMVVTALGTFGGLVLFVVVGFFVANCERIVDGFRAGGGSVEEMEEYRRKYNPPR